MYNGFKHKSIKVELMQDNNNLFQQNPGGQTADTGGLPMPPNNDLPTVVPPTPVASSTQKPRRTIDGVSLDYGYSEPLPAPTPTEIPQQSVETPVFENNNNEFITPAQQIMPSAPVEQPVQQIMPTPVPLEVPQVQLTPTIEPIPTADTIDLSNPEPGLESEIPFEGDPSIAPSPFSQPTDDATNYIEQLATETETTPIDYGPVPSLDDNYDPNDIVINNPAPKTKKYNWLTTIMIAVAILGIGSSVFLFIQYRSVSGELQNAQYQMEQYQLDAESGQKASQQLESLQNTVREQSEKINDLKKENDELKNVSDDLKKAKEELNSITKKFNDQNEKMGKCLTNSDCAKFFK